jgi:hypothetical protein
MSMFLRWSTRFAFATTASSNFSVKTCSLVCHDHLTSSASSTEASVMCHRLFEIVLHERLSYKRKAPPIVLAPG